MMTIILWFKEDGCHFTRATSIDKRHKFLSISNFCVAVRDNKFRRIIVTPLHCKISFHRELSSSWWNCFYHFLINTYCFIFCIRCCLLKSLLYTQNSNRLGKLRFLKCDASQELFFVMRMFLDVKP